MPTQVDSVTAKADNKLAPWPVEAFIQLFVFLLYYALQGRSVGGSAAAYRHGWTLWRWENAHLPAPETALNAVLVHVPALAVAAGYWYATLHFVVTPAVLIWMYRVHPGHFRAARTVFVSATLIGLGCFYLYPTTPPRLLPGAGLHDTLADVHQWGWWGSQNSAPHGMQSLANEFAAMPSLHVAWAVWAGWLLTRHATHRAVRIAGCVYPVGTAVDVMATGNHYLLDVVAGAALIIAAALCDAGVAARRAPRLSRHEGRGARRAG